MILLSILVTDLKLTVIVEVRPPSEGFLSFWTFNLKAYVSRNFVLSSIQQHLANASYCIVFDQLFDN